MEQLQLLSIKKGGGLKSKIEGGEDGGDRGVMLKYQIFLLFLYNCSGTCVLWLEKDILLVKTFQTCTYQSINQFKT